MILNTVVCLLNTVVCCAGAFSDWTPFGLGNEVVQPCSNEEEKNINLCSHESSTKIRAETL